MRRINLRVKPLFGLIHSILNALKWRWKRSILMSVNVCNVAGNESNASTGDASSTTGEAVQSPDASGAAAAAAAHNYDGTPLVCFPSK